MTVEVTGASGGSLMHRFGSSRTHWHMCLYIYVYLVFDSDSNTIVFWCENCGSWAHQPGISLTYSYMYPYTSFFFWVCISAWCHQFDLCGIMKVPWCIGLKIQRFIHAHAHKPGFLLSVAVTPCYFSGGIMAISWCISSWAQWHIHIYDPMHSHINHCGIPHPLSGDTTSMTPPSPPRRTQTTCL